MERKKCRAVLRTEKRKRTIMEEAKNRSHKFLTLFQYIMYIMCVLVCFFEGTPVSFTHIISTVHQHHHISSFRSKSFGLYLRPLLFSKSEENWKQVCQCHQNVGSFLAVRVLVKMSRKSRWMYEQHEHWYDAEGLLEGILTNVDLFRSRSIF